MLEWQRRWEATHGRRIDVAELCRMYGVSRQTGYTWIRRFAESGQDLRSLDERSRRPKSNSRAVEPDIEELIVAGRKQRPRWGPALLRGWLVEKHPRKSFPSVSCIAAILKRRGLTAGKRNVRRGQRIEVTPPFPSCERPNDVWCMDFKGWFRTTDGERCYPFTLLDAFSRFLLRCEALTEPTGDRVQSILSSAFREFGLPTRLRSDGGPPFFSPQSPASLSRLGVWLLRLGIRLECIAPAKPQQNGRLERFHRTLSLEVEPQPSKREQQRAFDEFRRIYNFERPHSALGMSPPWSVYRRSQRRYPCELLRTDGPGHREVVNVRGFIPWRRHRVLIGEAFAGELVSIWPGEGTRWEVFFGSILLGHLDEQTPTLFRPARRAKGSMQIALHGDEVDPIEVSGMSVD